MPPWPRRFCCDEELAFIGGDGRDAGKDLAALRSRENDPSELVREHVRWALEKVAGV